MFLDYGEEGFVLLVFLFAEGIGIEICDGDLVLAHFDGIQIFDLKLGMGILLLKEKVGLKFFERVAVFFCLFRFQRFYFVVFHQFYVVRNKYESIIL